MEPDGPELEPEGPPLASRVGAPGAGGAAEGGGQDGALLGLPPESQPQEEEQEQEPEGTPEPPPPPPPARGTCLAANWQEERATNPLDQPAGSDGAPESFLCRHGHRGLLSLQFSARSATGTTAKDSYRRPPRTGLPVRGQHQALLEWHLYQKHSKDVFEEEVALSYPAMESQSITHRDYGRGGFLLVPPAPTKPHDYCLEQAQTFWMEHARQVPGVSSIQTNDTPFKKCAAFTTPVTEFLDQPMPYDPESYPKL